MKKYVYLHPETIEYHPQSPTSYIHTMAFRLITAKDITKTLKVTIQKTGRLGFTNQTAEEMQIDTDTFFYFGTDDQVASDLIMVKNRVASSDGYRAIKSGDYYYLNTAPLFTTLGYEYASKNIIFDVVRYPALDQEAGGEVYTMVRRASKTSKREPKKPKVDEPTLNFE